MTALPVVEHQVDALVDDILEDLVAVEVGRGEVEEAVRVRSLGVRSLGVRGRAPPRGGHRTAAPRRATTSGSITARVRRIASAMFWREVA